LNRIIQLQDRDIGETKKKTEKVFHKNIYKS